MQAQPKWANNKALLVELAQNFKLLQQQNKKLQQQLQAKSQVPNIQSSSTNTQPHNQSKSKHISEKQKDKYSKDQHKILKLYSYKTWEQFMCWIDQKLEESGQTIQINDQQNTEDRQGSEIKRVLSEILEQPDFQQSYTLEKPQEKNQKNHPQSETEMELMAIQNGKLRRQNIQLRSKLTQIRALYLKSLQN